MKKKIFFCGGGTGGHIFPSVGLTNYFKKKGYDTKLITDKRGIKYLKKDFSLYKILNIDSPTQSNFILNIFFFLKLVIAFVYSFIFLRKEKPNIVFGLGGYVSFPICLAASLLGIKILLYEPNMVIGRTNKFFLRFCIKIFTNSNKIINFPQKYLNKIFKSGNIISEEILNHKPQEKKIFNVSKTIIILGGSQGAKIFGQLIPKVIVELSKNYKINVIQQSLSEQINEIKNFYNGNNIKNVVFTFHENIVELISKADLAISRCGSSTIGELEFLGVPFVAIPYPFAKDDHQYHNAVYYENKGCCWILSQKKLNFDSIKKMLKNILNNDSELNLKRKNMFKNESQNSLLKIEKEIEKII